MPKTAKDNADEFSRLRWSFMRQKTKDKLLDDTLALLRILPETKALLDLAAAKNIEIRFNEKFIGTDDSGVTVINRTTGAVHIEIKPYKKPEDTVIALIHELRHVWQMERLGLTPPTMNRVENDAPMALLFMRVKEADAYAYTDLAIARINLAIEALGDATRKLSQITLDNGGQPPTQAQQDAVFDDIAAQMTAHLEADKRLAAGSFMKALGFLDSYDREAVALYQRRYLDPQPLPHASAPLTLQDVRKLTVAGTGATDVSYLDHLDDRAFAALVLKDVKPELLERTTQMAAQERKPPVSRPPAP